MSSVVTNGHSVQRLQNFVDGEFVAPSGGRYIESRDPSRGTVHVLVPDSDASDVERAVRAARGAFSRWSSTDPSHRSRLLHRAADLIESRSEEFVEAESRDQGKPLWMARTVDVPRSVLNFRHFANAVLCDKDMCLTEAERGVLHYVSRSPCGVAAIIVPWNLPLHLLTFKLAPALAHGNTAVAKPSEFTSLTAWMLCDVLKEAGFPDGVVNMVFGRGESAGEALVRHPSVRLVSFTGSDRAGLHIAAVASSNAKKVSLEMGGKNACIVFADANLDDCIPTLIRGSFFNQGQVCLSTSRIFIQKAIFDDFVKRFLAEVRKIRVGDPFHEDTWMGPVCSQQHFERVREYLEIARQEGATFLTGNDEEQRRLQLSSENKHGYFISPVVLTGLPDDSRCMQEEIFGPVTCLSPFEGETEVVRRANSVRYGLSASLWSRDVGRVHSVAQKLEAGTVWCNCWMIRNLHMPFGGLKQSGLGREGTDDSKEFYTEKKTICVKYATGKEIRNKLDTHPKGV